MLLRATERTGVEVQDDVGDEAEIDGEVGRDVGRMLQRIMCASKVYESCVCICNMYMNKAAMWAGC